MSGHAGDDGRDGYEGLSWTERAKLGPLRAGLDPADMLGRKNRYIDRIHRAALRAGLQEAERIRGRRSRRAIDYGCGGGRLFDALDPWTQELWGLDRNAQMLELARAQRVVPPERLVAAADIRALEPRSFDLFVTVYVAMTTAILDDVARDLERLAARTSAAVLIEQIDVGRGLTRARYEAAFARAGFSARRIRAIRLGTRSPFARLARSAAFEPAARTFAAAEMAVAPVLASRSAYADHLFVLSPVGR